MGYIPIFGLICPNCNHNTDDKPAEIGECDIDVNCPVCDYTIAMLDWETNQVVMIIKKESS